MRLPAEILAKSGRGEIADLRRELKSSVRKARPWRPLSGMLATFIIASLLEKLRLDVTSIGRILDVGLVLAFCFALALLEEAVRDWILARGKLKSFKVAAKERVAAVQLVLSGTPYALYLRDFFSEQTVMHPGLKGSVVIETSGYTEDPLTKPIAHHLPIVALLNKDDSHISSYVRRVVVPSSGWFERFEGYARHAALVIVSVDHLNQGLLSEVNWLCEQGLLSKTLFSVASQFREDAGQEALWIKGESLAIIYRHPRRGGFSLNLGEKLPSSEISMPDKVLRFAAIAAQRRKRNWSVRAPENVNADVALECLEPYLRHIPTVSTDGRDIEILIEAAGSSEPAGTHPHSQGI